MLPLIRYAAGANIRWLLGVLLAVSLLTATGASLFAKPYAYATPKR